MGTRSKAAKRNSNQRAWLTSIKKYQGCIDCRSTKKLTFDHRDRNTKEFTIAKKCGKTSRSVLWNEVKKCDVVCRSCHNAREQLRDWVLRGGQVERILGACKKDHGDG